MATSIGYGFGPLVGAACVAIFPHIEHKVFTKKWENDVLLLIFSIFEVMNKLTSPAWLMAILSAISFVTILLFFKEPGILSWSLLLTQNVYKIVIVFEFLRY